MIISKNSNIKKTTIALGEKNMTHSESVKILGTKFNDQLTWAHHIERGSDSLISQLKRRRNAVKYIAKKVSNKFATKYANSILISKLTYHIEIWGLCSRTQINSINKILIDTATHLTNIKFGRTNHFIMNMIKWQI